MFKLTKNLTIQGVGFSGFMREDLTRREGEIQGVETTVGAMYFANTYLSN